MTAGYDKMYLDDAMKNLGEAFDFAVNSCGNEADEFMQLFIASGVADCYEEGNPKFIAGKYGTELALDVFDITGLKVEKPMPQAKYSCSPEYWCGWILAYYQWKSGKTFREIHNIISCDRILAMYPTFHEASEEKFADTIELIIEQDKSVSKLQQQRKLCNLSQRELAEKSGVNLRTLQQYESGAKNIRKASVETVMALAKALGCEIEGIV